MKRKRQQQDIESAQLQALYSSALMIPPAPSHLMVAQNPGNHPGLNMNHLQNPFHSQASPVNFPGHLPGGQNVGVPHLTLGLSEHLPTSQGLMVPPVSREFLQQGGPKSLFLPALGLSATFGLTNSSNHSGQNGGVPSMTSSSRALELTSQMNPNIPHMGLGGMFGPPKMSL